MSVIEKPQPAVTVVDAPFWEAAGRGRLIVQRCVNCRRYQLPAVAFCPVCSGKLEWIDSEGRGTIHTFTIFHKLYHPGFSDDLPYNVAIVELDEGPLMITNVVGVPNDELKIGMAVHVVFEERGETRLPKFAANIASNIES